MTYSIQQLLDPQVVMGVISRYKPPGAALAELFGWGLPAYDPMLQDKANVEESPTDTGVYDIFSSSDKVASSVERTSAAARVPEHPVGQTNYRIPRQAESVLLEGNRLFNQRQIGSRDYEVSSAGERYATQQMAKLSDRFANFIEFQTAAMLRGSYSQGKVGDRWENVFSASGALTSRTVNYQIPATNLSQLAMNTGGNLITASWAVAGTDIPSQVRNISAAFVTLVGQRLSTVVLNSATWASVVANDEVQTQAGSAVRAYEVIAGHDTLVPVYELRSVPGVRWMIVDEAFTLWDFSTSTYATSKTKLIADNTAVFIAGDPKQQACYLHGPEAIGELGAHTMSFDVRYGMVVVPEMRTNPAGIELQAYLNGLPMLKNPNAIGCGTVIF